MHTWTCNLGYLDLFYRFLYCTQQRENGLLTDFCTALSKGRMDCSSFSPCWTQYRNPYCVQQGENELLMDSHTGFSKERMNCLCISILCSARGEWTAYGFPYCIQQGENELLTLSNSCLSGCGGSCAWAISSPWLLVLCCHGFNLFLRNDLHVLWLCPHCFTRTGVVVVHLCKECLPTGKK